MGEHSSYFQLFRKLFYKSTLESQNLKVTKLPLLIIQIKQLRCLTVRSVFKIFISNN